MIDHQRLSMLLDRPETRRLVDALKRRLERGITGGTFTLPDAEEAERRAVEQLLGRPPSRGRGLSVPVDALEAVLRRAGIAPDLPSAVAALRGPLRDIAAERTAQTARWDALHQGVAETAGPHRLWAENLAATGLLKRLAVGDPERAERLAAGALAVLSRLPAAGLSQSRLAAEVLGDAHGLDPGEPIAALVRRALALGQDAEEGGPEDDRALWAAAGVLVGGGITSQVLTLNLTAAGPTPTAVAVRALGAAGEPCLLTLRQLVRDHPEWDCDRRTVRVCENPAVVAEAAARLGPASAPLVCTQGQPGAAVLTLLRQLKTRGATILYHGDFDWPGIRIANGLMDRTGAAPWRMSAADYRSAPITGKPLSGEPLCARWDPDLTGAMQARGEAVEEECLLEALLADLADD